MTCYHCKSEGMPLVPVYIAMKLRKVCRFCFKQFLEGQIIIE